MLLDDFKDLLTNDILDVTRIESQTLKLRKEQFDLNDMILNVVQDYRNQLEKNKDKHIVKLLLLYDHEFDKKSSYNDNKSTTFIEADKIRITQVISNLLNNAVKFSKNTGEDNSISIAITNIARII
jgi:signal transduction histidine kinase